MFSLFRVDRVVIALSLAVVACLAATPALASGGGPTGERMVGMSAVEPAYNDFTGNLVYLLTPVKSPFPTHTNAAHSEAPLYLVEYPPSSTVPSQVNLNCMGVPGNCPDHDGIVAGVATSIMPGVYGTDPSAVPGHDHLVGIAPTGDFNIAWHVIEVLFTNSDAANNHLTTLSQINDAVTNGNAITVDLGFAFHCSVVSQSAYMAGTPV